MGKWRGEICLIGEGAVEADFKIISECSIYLAGVHIIQHELTLGMGKGGVEIRFDVGKVSDTGLLLRISNPHHYKYMAGEVGREESLNPPGIYIFCMCH